MDSADHPRAVTDCAYPHDQVCACGTVADPVPGRRVTCERCPPGASETLFRLRIAPPDALGGEGCVACSRLGTESESLAEYADGERYPCFCAPCLRIALELVARAAP